MALAQVLEVYELLERSDAGGELVATLFGERGIEVYWETIKGEGGQTDVVRLRIPGTGGGPTLGIIGQLGGIGARPEMVGLVSDADGAITALAAGLKLADLARHGDSLPGDVLVATHICPRAPTVPHDPVPFMGSPVAGKEILKRVVDPRMAAILAVDTTRGNRIIKWRGFAISPTVMQGYILPVAPDLVSLAEIASGAPCRVVPLSQQDITPYGNGLYHMNSIMQPCIATASPVVGVAITADVPVPGSASGASDPFAIEQATRFCVEVAKAFTRGKARFYDPEQWERLVRIYGSMERFQHV